MGRKRLAAFLAASALIAGTAHAIPIEVMPHISEPIIEPHISEPIVEEPVQTYHAPAEEDSEPRSTYSAEESDDRPVYMAHVTYPYAQDDADQSDDNGQEATADDQTPDAQMGPDSIDNDFAPIIAQDNAVVSDNERSQENDLELLMILFSLFAGGVVVWILYRVMTSDRD